MKMSRIDALGNREVMHVEVDVDDRRSLIRPTGIFMTYHIQAQILFCTVSLILRLNQCKTHKPLEKVGKRTEVGKLSRMICRPAKPERVGA